MKAKLKKFVGMPLIVVILAVILIIGIASGELRSAIAVLPEVRPWAVAGCVLCFAGYLLFDALGIHSALKRQGYRLPFRETFLVALRGQYYYYITPGASGGQPMQVYYLRQLGVPAGVGTSVMVCHFAAFQTMLSVLMTLFAIPYYGVIRRNIDPHVPLLILGYLVNAGMVAAVLLFSFARQPVQALIRLSVTIARKFQLSRHPEALEKRLSETASLFHESMDRMRQHPLEIVRQLFLGGVQQLLLMSTLYVIYRGLGHSASSYPEILAMGLAQYISAAYVPIPGASGAQEGVFSMYFRHVFPGGHCFAAMMLWRITTFYLPLIVSAISILFYRRKEEHKETGHA